MSDITTGNDAATAADLNEVATTGDGKDITRGFIPKEMELPAQDTLLQARGGGNVALYKAVLSDPQVKSTFAQRQLAVVSRPWEVQPGGKRAIDNAAADFLKEQLENVAWDRATEQMLYGVFYGYAVAEILWGRNGGKVTLDAIKVRDRRRFAFDGDMQLRLRTMQRITPGEPLPPRKFWYFNTGADHGDEPYGLGLAHWCYWPVFFKRNGIKFWLIFLEKFGQPTAVGKYPSGAPQGDKDRLLAALSAITTDSGIIVPEGMLIELLEAARSGTSDYATLHDKMDATIAKVVLGQTLTSEAMGGQYKAQVQMDVRQDLVKADADLVCESFNNGPARWLTEWNFPGAEIPRVFRKVDEGKDLKAQSEVDLNLHSMGYEPEEINQINDTYGGRWKKKIISLPLPVAKGAASDPAQFAEAPPAVTAAIANTVSDQQVMDAAAEEYAKQYRAIIGPRINDLIAYAEHSGDLVTLRDRINDLLAAPPLDVAVEGLERGAFTAHLLGQTASGAK
jgi:phage gp29-like protein